ncbi:MAG TPA: hypothetical protein VNA04_05185 [Thermoanaerobaculia bacterium]|nr:hypothetical protein [Thermoanaerobaculia bacterium]
MPRAGIALVLLVAGCSSGGVDIVRPEIQIIQLYGPTDLASARGQGSMTAQFAFRVLNRALEPITLRRVQLESSGDGGYALRREDRPFSIPIGPGEIVEERVEALAYFRLMPSGSASNEPVTLRATFHFDSPAGSFRQIVLRNIGQFSDGPR